MPKLTIDGKEIAVEAGTKIIEAAKRLGIEVPFYCYHPGLSIAGNCRLCMVEIEKNSRTQIACNTDCADGMVVHTQSEQAKETRRHILEFLLANHPLDCPVCDQAGECWLQDYYMRFGLYDGRFYEEKVKKPKAVSIGPTVMLDAERCILCSRCVRFTDEITKTSELGIVNRGDHSEISVHPDKELNNKYSGNVVDICPVGALTDKDFRFKCRVWYLKKTDSICPGCSRGCNIEIHYNLDRPQHGEGARVMRLKPRENSEVNQWWMCDAGRYGYKFIDENRIEKPLIRSPHPSLSLQGGEGEGVKIGDTSVVENDWDQILDQAAERIKNAERLIGVFLSPQLSNEELYLAKKLFSGYRIFFLSPNPEGDQDDFLIRSDKNPNTKGGEILGLSHTEVGAIQGSSLQTFLHDCESGNVEGVIIFGQDFLTCIDPRQAEPAWNALAWKIFIGSNQNLTSESSTLILPSATYAEKNGTFTAAEATASSRGRTAVPVLARSARAGGGDAERSRPLTNLEGRIQKFNKAFEPLGESRPEWVILQELAKRLGMPWSYANEEEIFNEMAREIPALHGLSYEKIGSQGMVLNKK